jgi:predicted permease
VRELVTRLALGASRWRVTRELILEGVLLAVAGGLAGVAAGRWILHTLLADGVATLPNSTAIRIDATVIAGTLAISLLVGIVVGLVPAASLARANLSRVLSDGSRYGTGGRSARVFRRGLIVTQIAASVVLLAGAALLLTSFRNLLSVDAGFTPERVVTATIFPPPSRYEDARAVAVLSSRVLDALRSIPGVRAAGLTSNIALSGRTSPATVSAADRRQQPGEAPVLPSVVIVSPGYFEAMGTPLLRGRYFAESDRERSQPVAIVDERLAARLWPDGDAIGKGLYRGESPLYTVVGVVRTVRFDGLAGRTDSLGAAYFPHTQAPFAARLRWIAVKTAGDAAAAVPALRTAVASVDPDLPLSDIQTMDQRTSQSVAAEKLAMALASAFGVVALLLSIVGVYGVLSYVVARRTREIGIRIALGSSARGVFRLVFSEGLALVAAGLTFGLIGALLLGRALEGQVFGITPTDPFVLGTAIAATGFLALVTCVSPAVRATRVDPLIVLNEQ